MDTIAIALTLCWAGVFFLLTILFEVEKRRLEKKLEVLKGAKTTRWWRRCFSIDWEEDRNRRKIIAARGILCVIIMYASLFIGYLSIRILGTFGYAMFVPFLGIPILMDNGFDMYSYSRKVRKEPVEKLQDKDQEYMMEAIEVFAKRRIIYLILGFVFFVVAPSIPLLFNVLPLVIGLPLLLPAYMLGPVLGFYAAILFFVLPMALLIKYKWVIQQMMTVKRLIASIILRLGRNES